MVLSCWHFYLCLLIFYDGKLLVLFYIHCGFLFQLRRDDFYGFGLQLKFINISVLQVCKKKPMIINLHSKNELTSSCSNSNTLFTMFLKLVYFVSHDNLWQRTLNSTVNTYSKLWKANKKESIVIIIGPKRESCGEVRASRKSNKNIDFA